MILGGCSLGKNTIGNRMLGSTHGGILTLNQMDFFETRSRSCRKSYQTLSNGITRMRTTVVKGFVSDIKQNLPTLYEIVRFHVKSDITFHRVLYFLPREVCDESCVKELRLLRVFYGSDIFKCMVAIATTGELEHSTEGPSLEKKELYFSRAFSAACVDNAARCPPVEYVSSTADPEEIIRKINSANVEEERGLKLNRSHWRIKEIMKAVNIHEVYIRVQETNIPVQVRRTIA